MRLYDLVMTTWKRYLDSGGPELGPTGAIERVLMELGLADAEVLEGEYSGMHARSDGDPSFGGVPIFSDLDAWFQHNIMAGKREGRVRVIVLPQEEKKK